MTEIEWPPDYDRTDLADREPYPGDLSPTRKESFQSVVDELERWGATEGSVVCRADPTAGTQRLVFVPDRGDAALLDFSPAEESGNHDATAGS